MSTPPPDAQTVTHSGKICGSPLFALFRHRRASRTGNGLPNSIKHADQKIRNARAAFRAIADSLAARAYPPWPGLLLSTDARFTPRKFSENTAVPLAFTANPAQSPILATGRENKIRIL
jgi:hypothetical protein